MMVMVPLVMVVVGHIVLIEVIVVALQVVVIIKVTMVEVTGMMLLIKGSAPIAGADWHTETFCWDQYGRPPAYANNVSDQSSAGYTQSFHYDPSTAKVSGPILKRLNSMFVSSITPISSMANSSKSASLDVPSSTWIFDLRASAHIIGTSSLLSNSVPAKYWCPLRQ